VIDVGGHQVVGFLYREYGMGGVEHDAWGFFLVCVPIVCLGAPFGSLIGSHVHRLGLSQALTCLFGGGGAGGNDRRRADPNFSGRSPRVVRVLD
jgi:hypothetical protein